VPEERVLHTYVTLYMYIICACAYVCVWFRSLQFQAMHRPRLKTCLECCWHMLARCLESPSYIKSQLGLVNRSLTLARNLR